MSTANLDIGSAINEHKVPLMLALNLDIGGAIKKQNVPLISNLDLRTECKWKTTTFFSMVEMVNSNKN